MMVGIVIVGAGLAGDTAAAELRSAGYGGRIVLVGDEPGRPYDRPPLSKDVLLSTDAAAKVFLRQPEWYGDQGIELRLGDPCTAIDAARRTVALASGDELPFAKLLLATGASPRRLPLLEGGATPLYYLRSLVDAHALRDALDEGRRVVIVGGGVIGMEVAASAVQRGCEVTVLETQDRIMGRCVSPRVSTFVTGHHVARGARILCGVRLAAQQNLPGHVLLEGGETIAADLIVAGIGTQPNIALADAAGLRVDDGIVVDRTTRTSHPDIYAAGDVTKFESDTGYRRAEHWRHAIDQATLAAQVMAGGTADYVEAPWLWTDQYALNIQVTGEGHGDIDVLRGRMEDDAFILFHLNDGRIVGATSVNQSRHKRAVAALVAARATVDPARLADPATDLKNLLARAA